MEHEVAEKLAALSEKSKKPLIVHSELANSDMPTLAPIREIGLPIYSSLESTAKVMAALLIGAGPQRWGATHAVISREGRWQRAAFAGARCSTSISRKRHSDEAPSNRWRVRPTPATRFAG